MELERLGIPQPKIKQLCKAGIETVEDIARFYPRGYNDFRSPLKISQLHQHEGELVSVVGKISSIKQGGTYTTAYVQDDSGGVLGVTWFGQPYIERRLFYHQDYVFCGKVQYSPQYDSLSIVSPVFFSDDPADFRRIMPIYKRVAGMAPDYLEGCVKMALSLIFASGESSEYLDAGILARLSLPDTNSFLRMIHAPQNSEELLIAERRKAADELFPFSMKMTQRKREFIALSPYKLKDDSSLRAFLARLPFSLTEGQAQAVQQIADAMKIGKRVDALVQGDVGCGKTVVSIALCAALAGNGYQSAVMAPTTVLAEQHYKKFKEFLEPLGINVAGLLSGMKAKEKRTALAEIASGKAQIVVGTHAVIAESVLFKDLALTIVDEEHRFGVEQRNLLRNKAKAGVHNISMTATPIPRTLAVTLYGENTDIFNIRTMPGGRKPVITSISSNEQKVYAAMYRQIQLGHQCYFVCPLVEDSDHETLDGVESAAATYKKLLAWFAKCPEVSVGMATGEMSRAAVAQQLDAFVKGGCHVLVATTIVEVGVDVPNATVMIIKNAERFGLAQLHQLRGRVGRGASQGYCVLLSTERENARLQIMTSTSDGFEIARRDMELRGSGNWVGIKQHGFDRCVTLMLQNPELYQKITKETERIFDIPALRKKFSPSLMKEDK